MKHLVKCDYSNLKEIQYLATLQGNNMKARPYIPLINDIEFVQDETNKLLNIRFTSDMFLQIILLHSYMHT